MEIIITHLTRMAPGYCCAAGFNPQTRQHFRPTLQPARGFDHRLTNDLLWINGGLLEVGAQIELGEVRQVPQPPEVEDCRCEPAEMKPVRKLAPMQLWALMRTLMNDQLETIFGAPLVRRQASLYLETGCGKCSLGYYPLTVPSKLTISGGLNEKKIRLSFPVEHDWINLSVTDIRLYQENCVMPDESIVEAVADKLKRESKRGGVILGLGLTRPFAESSETKPVHWLQVTGIHFKDQ